MSNADNDVIIKHVQDTFCLDENDLHRMYEVFCLMAAKGKEKDVANGPPSTDKSSTKKQRKKREKKKPSRRPWEANENDSTASKEVTLSFSNFFTTFQPTQRCNNGGYMDAIFDLCGTKDLHAMTFPEFISSICTFATFKVNDMIKFVFFILDKQKAGCISRLQLMRFVERIHVGKCGVRVFELSILPHKSSHNLSSCNDDYASTSSVTSNKDISCIDNHESMSMMSMNYNQLQTLVNEYPTIIEPLFLFQNKLRVYIMGENWWRRKEGLIKKRYLYSATHNDDDDNDATQRQEPRRSWFRRLLYHLLKRRREGDTQWRAGG